MVFAGTSIPPILFFLFTPEMRRDPSLLPMLISMVIFALGFFFSGYFMKIRRYRWFSLAWAGIICMGFPLLTILGGFTIAVLCRRRVLQMYAAAKMSRSPNVEIMSVGRISNNFAGSKGENDLSCRDEMK